MARLGGRKREKGGEEGFESGDIREGGGLREGWGGGTVRGMALAEEGGV